MDLTGKLLGNRYEIIEKIGDGGMATVYKAKCRILNRKVAIKVLKDEYSKDQEFIKRFQIEAQSAASLSHPNIVSIYDVANESDLHYIVMELIEGITLKQMIRENVRLPWRKAVEFASQIALGLAQAHKNHIIHRDIKPHNIIITKDGVAKITDFGIAKAVTSSTINASGNNLGSVHYFSPEHARGGYTDEKSDLYSLGVVLYEMVTGKLPFESDSSVGIALKHLQEEAIPPIEVVSTIPKGLNSIILKAMKKNVSERYASAQEMYSDLQRILKSPNDLDVGENSSANLKNFATQKVPVIGAKLYGENNRGESKVNLDYMGNTKKKGRSKKQALIRLFLLVLLAIGVVALSAFVTTRVLSGITVQEEDVEVPYVQGYSKEEAENILKNAGLVMEVQARVESEEYPKDYVVKQEREKGYRLKKGSTLGVTLSEGAKKVLVPDVTTGSLERAKLTLETNGLVFAKEEEASSTVEAGKIIRQDPVYNTEVAKGTTVTVYISTGVPDGMVTVPNVLEYEEAQARDVLSTMQLIPKVTYTKKVGEADGKILSQTPEAGSSVSELTEIVLVINRLADDENPTENPDNNSGNTKPGEDKTPSGNDKPNTKPVEDLNYITIDLSNKGARDTFTVRVELQGDITGKKILHEAKHSRSDGKIKVGVSKEATGLIKVFIDNELDSEMVL